MSKNEEKEGKMNILALGNFAVGKTSYIIKYTENTFQQVYLTTTGLDYKTKKIILPNNKEYILYFYDTTGEERFRSISLNLIKNTDGILLFYDITQKSSFQSISGWIQNIYEKKDQDFPIILLGNKCDLKEEREVSKEEGEKLGSQYGIKFYEISNKEGINIEEPCKELIDKIIEYQQKTKNSNNDENKFNITKKQNIDRENNYSSCPC